MKIAFVWKWWSGKSTISSLFTKHLLEKNIDLIWIDADINLNFFWEIWINLDKNKALSNDDNKKLILEYLKWDNKLIENIWKFFKTTPPWKGSRLFTIKWNEILENISEKYKSWYFMFVGSYGTEWLWNACFHKYLSVLQNILTHTKLENDELMIVDMVAGTDSFGSSLYALFDLIFLVVEASPESISVANDFISLADYAWVRDKVRIIANKVEDEEDLSYIKDNLNLEIFESFEYSKDLKKSRQKGNPISLENFNKIDLNKLENMHKLKDKIEIDENKKLKIIHKLHEEFCEQEWIQNLFWDMKWQIDKNFKL